MSTSAAEFVSLTLISPTALSLPTCFAPNRKAAFTEIPAYGVASALASPLSGTSCELASLILARTPKQSPFRSFLLKIGEVVIGRVG